MQIHVQTEEIQILGLYGNEKKTLAECSKYEHGQEMTDMKPADFKNG